MSNPLFIDPAKEADVTGRSEQELHAWQQVLDQDPNNLEALFKSAIILERNSEYIAAATRYERILSDDVAPINAMLCQMRDWIRSRAATFFYAGIACMQEQRFDEALAFFLHITVDGFPRRPSLYLAGLCCFKLRFLHHAVEMWKLLLQGMPKHIDAWFNLGNAEALSGKMEDAAEAYKKALALKPDFVEALYNLRVIYNMPASSKKLLERYWQEGQLPKRYRETPIFINCRDRVSALRLLIEWLQSAGYTNIYLIDNHSSYPPLLSFYQEIESGRNSIKIIRLKLNYGHQALWEAEILKDLAINTSFVYSDPDIVPVDECPTDVIHVFEEILQQNPFVQKVGFGLKIDDIPDHFSQKAKILVHERAMWEYPMAERRPKQYLAPIDTTFALHRHGLYYEVPYSIRTGYPYMARHYDWYQNTDSLSDETRYYYAHALKNVSSTQSLIG